MRFYLLTTLVLLLGAPILIQASLEKTLETIFRWKLLEFGFPTSKDKQEAIANGNLVEANGVPIDVAPYYNATTSKVFITTPRFSTGVPYSLAIVSEREVGPNGPVLKPYPNYKWHSSHGGNCDDITSAFRVWITECNQMWIIDSGVIGSDQHCPPQLLLFDLNTDELVHRYRFNTSLYIPVASLFILPVVDVRDPAPGGNCQRTMIYVADVDRPGLVVYNYEQNAAWRVSNRFMFADPDHGRHTIAGESFTLMDSIFGMCTDRNNLYFHPLASFTEYSVPLSILDDPSNFVGGGITAREKSFKRLGNRQTECAAEAIDSRNNIYCVTFNPIALIKWNVNTTYTLKNMRVLSKNTELLQFVSGMKVVRNEAGKEELWMLSNRYQKIATGTLQPDEINFRVIKRTLDDLQNGANAETINNDLHNRLVFS